MLLSPLERLKKHWPLAVTNDIVGRMNPPEANIEKKHILHVDDDPDIRLLISASLRDFGYIVATAGSVAEARQLAKELKFDLCILDVRLPDGTGIELCQQLRRLQPGVPVLYYSAYASDAEQKVALSVCGDAYLKKPVLAADLQQTINRLLNLKSK